MRKDRFYSMQTLRMFEFSPFSNWCMETPELKEEAPVLRQEPCTVCRASWGLRRPLSFLSHIPIHRQGKWTVGSSSSSNVMRNKMNEGPNLKKGVAVI